MSNICEIKVPDVGNVHDIDVVEVSIQAGDVIVLDQTIATLETDKASMDLPATATGTVQQVHIKVGDKVNEGTLIATVLVDDVTATLATPVFETAPASVAEVKPADVVAVPVAHVELNAPTAALIDIPVASQTVQTGSAHASPSVRLFARELGVDLSQITQGSGRKGRILKDDVKHFVKKILVEGVKTGSGAGIPSIPVPDFSAFGAIDIQPLSKISFHLNYCPAI